jgi:alpha-L-fucosidase 2
VLCQWKSAIHLQYDGGNIYILPALPDKWKNGSVKGFAARENITADIE